MSLLAVERLSVRRGARQVLRELSLSVDGGSVTGVLGPSGAGKSTLFRAICGELTATSGKVFFDGHDVTAEPIWERARRGLGYVPQSPSVLWDLTVIENLTTFHRLAGKGAGLGPDAVATQVGLHDRRDVRAGALSGGERRRLELARALVRTPKVLVCDEPFAGIDPAGAERLGEILSALGREGVAVVLADHHVAEALRTCTHAILLLDGEVRASGSPDEFARHPLVRERYLGRTSLPPSGP